MRSTSENAVFPIVGGSSWRSTISIRWSAEKEACMLDRPTVRSSINFDETIAEQIVRYGRMVAKRGYIHNSLGNIAIRVLHPDYQHGIAYTKHSGISLEEMTIENVVITDIPTTD